MEKNIFLILLLLLAVTLLLVPTQAEHVDYIYFDLNCSSVNINESTYSGCVYQNINGEITTLSVSGKHSSSNFYYVYQSNDTNKATTGYVDEKYVIPVYDSLSTVVEGFINNTDVDSVISTWRDEATDIGRKDTPNVINISGNSIYDVTIDNLWSSSHNKGTGRIDGGIAVIPSAGMKTSIKLKGDNRFGNVHYYNASTSSSLTFTSFDGDKETTGSMTVANLVEGASNNYWNSAIGGTDNKDVSINLNFAGGTIYAGTTVGDNCTAIGGGGNGKGGVNISGGIITAVSNSTGTAIGGGIGMSSHGGNAEVKISGGEVYAYNSGYVYAANVFVPGVAIGGGSSRYSDGNASTIIDISGGKVYAESRGGVAIGGGSSATKNGGIGTVSISGNSEVTAESVAGNYVFNGTEYLIAAGSGIGGGTGGTTGNGGNAVVTISGGTINSGTIGGGETNNPTGTVGSATIKINDGTVNGRVIMHTGTFDMSGGVLTGGTAKNGGCVQMHGGTATVTGGEITKCSATENGGAIYLDSSGGNTEFIQTGGKIHNNFAVNGGGVYIANGTVSINNGSIEKNKVSENGAGVYIGGAGNFNITGGIIKENEAPNGNGGGIYLNSGKYTMENGTITLNKSKNGAGAYVNSAKFSLTGGGFTYNEATEKGGGFYIGDNSSVELSNGSISKNVAVNGGGFYQTQLENETITNISGNCLITENEALNGNGGGVYIDGGSTFRMIGGKVTYNQATFNSKSSENIIAKDSASGVGGGVYILSGIFTMYNEENVAGNAAIFGNIAHLAADDLFASGENTSFDAISVANMEKADAYKTADSWFEDFPLNESHTTLNKEHREDDDSSNDIIISPGRYKNIEDIEDKKIASTVLYRNCTDYIAITMGNSVGSINISIKGNDETKQHGFIYKIESCSNEMCNDINPELSLNVYARKGEDVKIIEIASGKYKITTIPSWSWRYYQNTDFEVTENSVTKDKVNSDNVIVNVYTDQITNINTYNSIYNRKWLSETKFTTWSNM